MSITTRQKKLLNEREIFLLWYKLGTTTKVYEHLISEGRFNPNTGEPFSTPGIWFAARRFVADYPEEARQYYIQDDPSGRYKDDDEWDKFVLGTGLLTQIKASSKKRFVRWAKKTKTADGKTVLYYRYFDQFKKRFGLTEDDRQISMDI